VGGRVLLLIINLPRRQAFFTTTGLTWDQWL